MCHSGISISMFMYRGNVLKYIEIVFDLLQELQTFVIAITS